MCALNLVQDNIGPVTDSNRQLIDDDLPMCEEFNSYFTSVFTREDISTVSPEADKLFNVDEQVTMLDIFFNQDEVLKRVNKLHCNEALGVEG